VLVYWEVGGCGCTHCFRGQDLSMISPTGELGGVINTAIEVYFNCRYISLVSDWLKNTAVKVLAKHAIGGPEWMFCM